MGAGPWAGATRLWASRFARRRGPAPGPPQRGSGPADSLGDGSRSLGWRNEALGRPIRAETGAGPWAGAARLWASWFPLRWQAAGHRPLGCRSEALGQPIRSETGAGPWAGATRLWAS